MAAQVSPNLGLDVLQGSGQQLGDFSYSQLAQHFQSSIAQMAERQAHTVVQASRCDGLGCLTVTCLFADMWGGVGPPAGAKSSFL